MGHTNSTVNYNLPQFVGTDKPSWLGDVNGAFLAIDTAIAAAKTEADSAAGGVAGLQTTVGSHTTQIGTLTDTVTAQGGTLNSVTALIGNGTPTTTDQTIIGAINEINDKVTPTKVEAAANQTYSTQLSQLKSTFDTLTEDEKLRSKLYVDTEGAIYECSNVSGMYTGTIAITGSFQHVLFNLASATALQSVISTNGTVTQNDFSANTNTHKFIIVY